MMTFPFASLFLYFLCMMKNFLKKDVLPEAEVCKQKSIYFDPHSVNTRSIGFLRSKLATREKAL